MSGSTITVTNGNVYIKQNSNGVIQSSLDNSTYTNITWPLQIVRNISNTNTITVYIVNNLTITDILQYFIVGSNNITFDGFFNGLIQTITINIENYSGLIQNGTGTITNQTIDSINTLSVSSAVNGYNNININNISIYIPNTNEFSYYIARYGGLICQSFFGYNSTNNNINNCNVKTKIFKSNISYEWTGCIVGVFSCLNNITNCYTTSNVVNNSSGILGPYSKCTLISNCYITGNINENSGGIVGSFCQSSLNVENCFCYGDNGYNYSGSIIGNDYGYNTTNTLIVSGCFVTGSTYGAGAIVGGSVYYVGDTPTNIPPNKPTIIVSNCYLSGFTYYPNNINYAMISYQLPSYTTSITLTNAYCTNNSPWNDTDAKAALDNTNNTWIYPNPSVNLPYILTSMENTTPPYGVITYFPYKYVYMGSSITLSVNYIGSTPINVNWYFNGVLIPNENLSTITINNAQKVNEGKYTAILYNAVSSFNYNIYLNVVSVSTTIIELSNDCSINVDGSGNIQYDTGSGYTTITSWPVLLIGNNYNQDRFYINIRSDFNINSTEEYFIFGSSQIIILGSNHLITLNIPINTPFDGLFENGTETRDGYDINNIQDLKITGNALLNDYGGFIYKKYWNKNTIQPGDISGCSCDIEIKGDYSGGLVGAYSKLGGCINCYTTGNITGNYSGGIFGAYYYNINDIQRTYSTGNIVGDSSGGIIGAFFNNKINIRIHDIFSTGDIIGNNAGGLIGSDVGINTNSNNTLNIYNCYTLGNISNNAGGIIGGLTIQRTQNKNINMSNCYVNGLYNNNNNNSLIAPSMNIYVNLTKLKIYTPNNNWINSNANNNLSGVGSTWTTYSNNIPYLLSSLSTSIPITIISISSAQYPIVNSNLSIQVLANGSATITYQWQYSVDDTTYNNIPVTTYNYNITNIMMNQTGYYKCIVSNNINTITTNSIYIKVLSASNPTITNISPNEGSIVGGNKITITGTNFSILSSVKFGTVSAKSVSFVSATKLSVTVPASIAGYCNVTVKNNITSEISPITNACIFTYINVPTAPLNIFATAGNGSATITWTPLSSNQNILYYTVYCSDNTIPSKTTSNNNLIFGGLNNNSSYTLTVSATNSYKTGPKSTSSNSIIPRNTPNIINISNNNNINYSLIGTSSILITINGSNFYDPILSVKSNDNLNNLTITNLTVISTTQITCLIQNTIAGIYNFTLYDVGGIATFNSGYKFYNIPTITNVSPNIGSSIGATPITITGTNFIDISNIVFDSRNIDIYNYSPTSIIFNTLSKNINNNPIISITSLGTTIETNLFNYVLPPTLTSTTTDTGANTLTIIGNNFDNATISINDITIPSTNLTITTTQIIISSYTYDNTSNIKIITVGGIVEFINQSNTSYTYVATTISSISNQ